MLRHPLLVLAAVAACSVPVWGQDNPLSTEAKSDYKVVRNLVIRAAEKVPEAGYSFKPTPEVRSFSQLIGHIADDQYRYCSAAKGEDKSPQFEKDPPPKAEMVAALKSAFEYCDTAYEGLVDASATEKVMFLGQPFRNSSSSLPCGSCLGALRERSGLHAPPRHRPSIEREGWQVRLENALGRPSARKTI